jgi:hypothetical protein
MGQCHEIFDPHWEFWSCFRGLIETSESASAFSLKPLNPLPLWHWDRRIRFRSQSLLLHSIVLKTTFLRKIMFFLRIPWSHWNRRSCFCGLNETAKSASAFSLKLPNSLLWSHWNRRSRPFQTNISNFCVNLKPIWETALAVNQGPRVDWLMKTTDGRKSRYTVPLNKLEGNSVPRLLDKERKRSNLSLSKRLPLLSPLCSRSSSVI